MLKYKEWTSEEVEQILRQDKTIPANAANIEFGRNILNWASKKYKRLKYASGPWADGTLADLLKPFSYGALEDGYHFSATPEVWHLRCIIEVFSRQKVLLVNSNINKYFDELKQSLLRKDKPDHNCQLTKFQHFLIPIDTETLSFFENVDAEEELWRSSSTDQFMYWWSLSNKISLENKGVANRIVHSTNGKIYGIRDLICHLENYVFDSNTYSEEAEADIAAATKLIIVLRKLYNLMNKMTNLELSWIIKHPLPDNGKIEFKEIKEPTVQDILDLTDNRHNPNYWKSSTIALINNNIQLFEDVVKGEKEFMEEMGLIISKNKKNYSAVPIRLKEGDLITTTEQYHDELVNQYLATKGMQIKYKILKSRQAHTEDSSPVEKLTLTEKLEEPLKEFADAICAGKIDSVFEHVGQTIHSLIENNGDAVSVADNVCDVTIGQNMKELKKLILVLSKEKHLDDTDIDYMTKLIYSLEQLNCMAGLIKQMKAEEEREDGDRTLES